MTEIYEINEEIVRQALEVKFKINSKTIDEWFIAFSNPTAGPWKKIMFVTKDRKVVRIGGYEKEEKRPDLIVFSRTHRLLFIIEAKDYIQELITNYEKINETFMKEKDKLSKLSFIKEEFNNLFHANGLVFFSENIDEDYKKIKKTYAQTENLIVFFVTKEEDNLVIKAKTEIKDGKLKSLKNIIPF